MKKNNILNIIYMLLIIVCVVGGAVATSWYSKNNTPSNNSNVNFSFDMNKWNYDEKNNVYYKMNIDYCERSKDNENQKFDIYVPGEFLIGKVNTDGTYNCKPNLNGIKNRYNIESAPMIIEIQSKSSIEQETHRKYDYQEISEYINEGYIYIWPGMRGLKEKNLDASEEEKSTAIIEGITDLKALIRFCRFNKGVIPGNTERIIAYGTKDGGTKSVVLGASGDNDAYSSKLISIGAIMTDDEGINISDSANMIMCCSPINIFEITEKSFAWSIGQYINEKDLNKQENNKELATQYAEYVNSMKLKSENGSLLYLTETEQGIYTNGTYYNYMLSEIEKSINSFLQNTIFPYNDIVRNKIYKTSKEYIESLNTNVRWINYIEETNEAKIENFAAFAKFYLDKNPQIEVNQNMNIYNPYYYLSSKYKGIDSSYICRNWNICTLLDEKYNNFLPEENLKLILEKNENVRTVNYSCIWANDYSENEKEKILFEKLKTCIQNTY